MAEQLGFVAGATGLTGRSVVEILRERGLGAIAHVRPDSSRLEAWRSRFEAMGAEVDTTPWDEDALTETLRERAPQLVFALLGTTKRRARRADDPSAETYEAVDYGLTAMLRRAAERCGHRPRFVYLSSMGVKEGTSNAYLAARARIEKELREGALPWTSVRPSFIVGDRDEARAGEAVVITLTDEIDVSRGDMLVRPQNVPEVETGVEAMMCWMAEEPLQSNRHYILRHTTREVKAFVDEIVYRVDVNTLHREDSDTLQLNEIGRVRVTTAAPLFFDPYRQAKATGAFVLIDPYSNATVAAGMIRGAAQSPDEIAGRAARLERSADAAAASEARQVSPNVVWEGLNIPREEREAAQGHQAAVLWFTGLSGSGKTTVAREVERRLFDSGIKTMLLDGDQVRHGLNGDLGFSAGDRRENVRRIGEVARLFFESGAVTLCTFVSPYRTDRDRVRALVPEGRFIEIHVDVDVETAQERDPKGIYAKAQAGEITNLTGIDAPYEAPEAPELTLKTADQSVQDAVEAVLAALAEAGIVERGA